VGRSDTQQPDDGQPESAVGGGADQEAAAAGVLVLVDGVDFVSDFFSVDFSVVVDGELSAPDSDFATVLPAPTRLSVR
jgi:hypothetical protein